jgi:phage terminase large subunit
MIPEAPRAQFPNKLRFLFKPHPYKIVWGGRDGLKSWSMARALLIMGAENKIRWLCARETQQSIAESVHHLLETQISELGLHDFYRVEKARIIGTRPHMTGMYGRPLANPGTSEFVFAGLKHNVNQIKSFEALDGVWVEEAVNVSKNSWDVVLPTIRTEGSEVWVSYNPELITDETHVRWVLNPPPGAVVVKTSYLDNNWLSESSRIKLEHTRKADPEGFRNIYGGEPRSSVVGAIFEKEIQQATEQKRIGLFPRDRMRTVDTFWDLGFGDKTAIWFGQTVDGWYRMVDYLEDDGQTIEHYLTELQSKGYLYGSHWLPHDCVDTIIHQKLASGDKSRSIEMIMRAAGLNVRVAPKLHVTSRINAARTIFPMVQFNQDACQQGLHMLRRYQWGPLNKNNVTGSDPMHNDASHGADAFQTFAVCAKQPKAPEKPKAKPPAPVSAWT